MAVVNDAARIRALLNHDRVWGVYALGDLQPEWFPKATWFTPDLTLVLREYGTCILFAMGDRSVAEALQYVIWPVHLQVQPLAMETVAALAVVPKRTLMWRMGWNGDRSGWPDTTRARRLTMDDVPALERLYADGSATGEGPDFFFPSMVRDGVFFGVPEGGEMAAVAGTHLYAPGEGAAAIGNIYTRRDRRGRGFGRMVTGAVLAAVAEVETVGLNVRADNAAAIHIYQSLGFRKHCEFFEALATGWR